MEFLGTTCTLRASPKGLRVQGFRGMENRRTLKSSKFPGWLLHSPRYGLAGLYGFVLLSGDPPAKAGFRAKGVVDMYIIYIYAPSWFIDGRSSGLRCRLKNFLRVAEVAVHLQIRRGCDVATDEDDVPLRRHGRIQAVVGHPAKANGATPA